MIQKTLESKVLDDLFVYQLSGSNLYEHSYGQRFSLFLVAARVAAEVQAQRVCLRKEHPIARSIERLEPKGSSRDYDSAALPLALYRGDLRAPQHYRLRWFWRFQSAQACCEPFLGFTDMTDFVLEKYFRPPTLLERFKRFVGWAPESALLKNHASDAFLRGVFDMRAALKTAKYDRRCSQSDAFWRRTKRAPPTVVDEAFAEAIAEYKVMCAEVRARTRDVSVSALFESAKTASAQDTPAAASDTSTSAESTPAETTPAETTPAEMAPAETASDDAVHAAYRASNDPRCPANAKELLDAVFYVALEESFNNCQDRHRQKPTRELACSYLAFAVAANARQEYAYRGEGWM